MKKAVVRGAPLALLGLAVLSLSSCATATAR